MSETISGAIKGDGKVAVVTGGSSGIGRFTALELARAGYTTVITARSVGRLMETADWIRAEVPGAAVETEQVDFASLASVRAMAARILERHPKIAILVDNAGMVMARRTISEDGFESILEINHLSPYLLTRLLLPAIKAAHKDAPARIVVTASNASMPAKVDFDDLQMEKGWGPMRVYGRSKLMNIMFTYALNRRLEGSGITVNAFHPGFVGSRIANKGGIIDMIWALVKPFVLTSAQGADTAVYLALSPKVADVTGKYFYKRQEIRSNDLSYDIAAQERLWQVSAEMTGLSA
ncbi:MAG TPA: SDR family oxidoreductase [Alphaproteobacteria bacterium]|nr:SDR family oxidoreductase [Alphaproteobacteria bacterium]